MSDWKKFFERDPLTCAREMIGCELLVGECGGTIIETEAYCAEGDPACHTFFRPSARKFVESHDAGTAYVYFNYGMYWLLNFLVKNEANPAQSGFVLIRALAPTHGIAQMQHRRTRTAVKDLCSGPGKLTQALAITGTHHGLPLGDSIALRRTRRLVEIETTPRIGISRAKDYLWRYLLLPQAD